jgi:hypothetical protein
MSATGMSKSGKDAAGWSNELNRYQQEQYKRNLEKGQTAYDRGRAGYNAFAQGVQDTRDAGTGFLNQPHQQWNNIYGNLANQWANTAGQGQANLGEWKNAIGKGYTDQMGFADQMSGRNDQTNRDNMHNIGSEFGALRKQNWDRYGQMQDENTALYGGLRDQARGVYQGAGQRADYLKPASEAAQAMVGRAFSPQMASTAMRLQQAGLRPGDPQYEAAMSRVESARARGMDDDLAKRTSEWVNTRNTLDQSGLNTDLGLAQTGSGIGRDLSTKQLGTNMELGMGQLGATTTEANRWLNTANQTDMNRQGITQQNVNNIGDWANKANQQNTQNFQIGADIQKDIANGGIQQAMQKYAIQQQQLAATGDVAKQEMLFAQMYQQLASQVGEEGARQAMANWQRESANANWLGKFGAGLAMSAVSGAAGGLTGGFGGLSKLGGGVKLGDFSQVPGF